VVVVLTLAALVALLTAASARGAGHAAMKGGRQSIQEVWTVGASSAWAWTQDESGPMAGGGPQGIEITIDGGRSWSDVTPPDLVTQGGKHWISGLFALNSDDAWVSYGALGGGDRQTILATIDGGRSWTPVGAKPHGDGCTLQFASPEVGWCVFIGAAAGSESVTIDRTVAGGRRWQVVSVTPIGVKPKAGTLPFPGDKSIGFSSTQLGWAGFEMPIGTAPLFETLDGGREWIRREVKAAPSTRLGGYFAGKPLLRGRNGAVGYVAYGHGSPYTILYMTADGGVRWRPVMLPGPAEPWYVDTLTPMRWRLLYGNRILETDDAGGSWRSITTNHRFGQALVSGYGSPGLDFFTERIGWIVESEPDASTNTLWRTVDGGLTWTQLEIAVE
jgi:photosystem II stability/assembly factor-like uncharacterized protein